MSKKTLKARKIVKRASPRRRSVLVRKHIRERQRGALPWSFYLKPALAAILIAILTTVGREGRVSADWHVSSLPVISNVMAFIRGEPEDEVAEVGEGEEVEPSFAPQGAMEGREEERVVEIVDVVEVQEPSEEVTQGGAQEERDITPPVGGSTTVAVASASVSEQEEEEEEEEEQEVSNVAPASPVPSSSLASPPPPSPASSSSQPVKDVVVPTHSFKLPPPPEERTVIIERYIPVQMQPSSVNWSPESVASTLIDRIAQKISARNSITVNVGSGSVNPSVTINASASANGDQGITGNSSTDTFIRQIEGAGSGEVVTQEVEGVEETVAESAESGPAEESGVSPDGAGAAVREMLEHVLSDAPQLPVLEGGSGATMSE